jgi:hypothetical protein
MVSRSLVIPAGGEKLFMSAIDDRPLFLNLKSLVLLDENSLPI